jgi:hypothetical protein
VGRLTPQQLADLVVEHARRDRLFAALLLGRAGMLDPADGSAVADFREAIEEVSTSTTGEWQICDLEDAGLRLAAEVDIMLAWPATPAMLDAVEEAIEVWDEMAGHLGDAHHDRRIDPEQISEPLVGAHHNLCERLGLDPDEISGRLDRLQERCVFTMIGEG